MHHQNVLSFELRTGNGRYYIVGCYLHSYSSLKTLEPVRLAIKDAPADKRVCPMLWRDLNANIDNPCAFETRRLRMLWTGRVSSTPPGTSACAAVQWGSEADGCGGT